MNKKILSVLLLCFMFSITLKSQNLDSLLHKIDFNFSSTSLLLRPLINRDVIIPDALVGERIPYQTLPIHPIRQETDNPLNHGSTELSFDFVAKIAKGYDIKAGLVLEHRGASYGAFNNNIVAYPIYRLDFRDTFKTISYQLEGGTFFNGQINNGLLVQNTNFQGGKASVKWSSLLLNVSYIGDLYNGIGLGVDELFDVGIRKELAFQKSKTILGIGLYDLVMVQYRQKHNFIPHISVKHESRDFSFYGELAYRFMDVDQLSTNPSSPELTIKDKLSFLIGAEYKNRMKGIHSKIEFRYYGKGFNFAFINDVDYRDESIGDIYSNTIGKQLYPLQSYQHYFNQWNVYTEYQGKFVYGINLFHEQEIMLHKLFSMNLVFDGNIILAEDEKLFFYPFFEASFNYSPSKLITLSILTTNRGMNLDLHYPSLYLYKYPYLGCRVTSYLNHKRLSKKLS